MCTSLEKGERVALGFLNTPPPGPRDTAVAEAKDGAQQSAGASVHSSPEF